MNNYTIEPWEVVDASDFFGDSKNVYSTKQSFIQSNGENIISSDGKLKTSDAERVVACINACRGVSTNDLQFLSLIKSAEYIAENIILKEEIEKLKKELNSIKSKQQFILCQDCRTSKCMINEKCMRNNN
jgi:hypothetical protein